MKTKPNLSFSDELAQRKESHIELAKKAQTTSSTKDDRFYYEPLFFSHPNSDQKWEQKFLNFSFDYPLWISSMTGGTERARTINHNLARLCGKYKLGMGLGSCRSLLDDSSRLEEFAVRKFMGSQPLFANIGIAQIESLIAENKSHLLHELVKRLEASGLIIHLNPLQEWLQPEGDRFSVSPLETLKVFLEDVNYPVIVKEVGQGLGPHSLKALLELPIAAIEFGAFGGTNFTLLESMRGDEEREKTPFISVGHTALEMVEFLNALPNRNKEFIISGGVRNVLDGYELKSKLEAPSVIGMAASFLTPALEGEEALEKHFLNLREALLTARGVLRVKGDN
jgi:isopentenyl-diphosphate delta-isomerase